MLKNLIKVFFRAFSSCNKINTLLEFPSNEKHTKTTMLITLMQSACKYLKTGLLIINSKCGYQKTDIFMQTLVFSCENWLFHVSADFFMKTLLSFIRCDKDRLLTWYYFQCSRMRLKKALLRSWLQLMTQYYFQCS